MYENILKLFLGVDEHFGDTDELWFMGQELKRKGFVLSRYYTEAVKIVQKQKRIDLLELAGGLTSICVAKTLESGLSRADIHKIWIHIDNCRSSLSDFGDSPQQRNVRINELIFGLNDKQRHDERIMFMSGK